MSDRARPSSADLESALKKSESWLDDTSKKARFNGAVRLIDLAFILAEDESNNAVIPKLWDILDLGSKEAIAGLKGETGSAKVVFNEVNTIIQHYDIEKLPFKYCEHIVFYYLEHFIDYFDLLAAIKPRVSRACIWLIILLRLTNTKYSRHMFIGLPVIREISLYRNIRKLEKATGNDQYKGKPPDITLSLIHI